MSNMERTPPEILKEKDILGLEKPNPNLKPFRKKNDGWMIILAVVIVVIAAAVLFYFKK